jgi:16S rRNA (uracil1498-N3)-methyltransferase
VGSRLRVPVSPLLTGRAILSEESGRYVSRVHRLGPGDGFVGFDPEAQSEADVAIESVENGGRRVVCQVGAIRRASAVARGSVTLLQAMGKGDKPEQVVRDATVLGATRVLLLYSARSVPRANDASEAKRKRYRAVAVEAARQSGRGDVPSVEGPLSFDDAIALVTEGVSVCLAPSGATSFAAALAEWRPSEPLAVLVGPEGGFDDHELATARAGGFVLASFGDFVLRTETAAVAVLGAVTALAALRR